MHRRSNPDPRSGDQLRDHAADLLASKYGEAKREYRADGKKVDVYFEYKELGRTIKIFLEAKDYRNPLGRTDVVHIKTDYDGILRRNAPSILLLVTREGLTPDAQSFIDVENDNSRHQTIWDIETGLIELETYLRYLIADFKKSGLSDYYIENGFTVRAPLAKEHEEHVLETKKHFDQRKSCFEVLKDWIKVDAASAPVAVLGGYGTGKTSLATRLAADLAENSIFDPHARQPIVLKLGGISQYANIEGLIAGHFTNTFPIRNFNFHNFITLNDKGRFVVILDGFDEMKHSMSWNDFRSQVKSLLLLQGSRSKVILLGRPSAFLSETEERYILKGERPLGESWVSLPDWPRFHELEISDFTDSERAEFIERYLAADTNDVIAAGTEARAKLTNEIASLDPELYKKPVHSKILTDLAKDPNFDLVQFKSASSRWVLYQEFMSSLYDREAEKRNRSDISTKRRKTFIGDLALWLWLEKSASISFSAHQIPKQFYGDIEQDDEDDLMPLCRELLVGSILERKSGDTFYFGHRSFAEFIVADRMLNRPPEPKDHERYSGVFRDGVREFLIDSGDVESVKAWAKTFSFSTGRISQAYIDFLSEPYGGVDRFSESLHKNSVWKKILKPFKNSLIPNKPNYHAVLQSLIDTESPSWAWRYCWITQLDGEGWSNSGGARGMGSTAFDQQIAICLLNSLFHNLQRNSANLFVTERHVGLRRVCHEALKTFEFNGRAEFEMSHKALGTACVRELKRCGLEWDGDQSWIDRSFTVNTDEIFKRLSKVAQDNLLLYLRDVRSWNSITERNDGNNDRREVSRSQKLSKNKKFRAPRDRDRRR